jgi:pseudouridine-5'-phosphate glycosidase
MLFVNRPPAELALPAAEVAAWLAEAVAQAEREGVRAGGVTPFVLDHVARASGGRALRANIGLIVGNSGTAGSLAVALASLRAAA